MLSEKQLEKYADVLIWALEKARHQKLKKSDVVLIRYDLPAIRLAEILHARLLGKGIYPVPRTTLTATMEYDFFKHSNNDQLTFHIPGDPELYNSLTGSIFLSAPESITHLGDIDPAKISKAALARKYLRDILSQREATGDFNWTLCMLPTKALAHHAGISLTDYTRQIAKACFLNHKDPLAQWQNIFDTAKHIKKWLGGLDVNYYRIQSRDVDLEITPGPERQWIGLSGHNIPSFEIFVSPDWHGTRGTYFANQPSFRSGNYVKNVWLEFKKGRVVDFKADVGHNFLKNQLAIDKGAGRLGEFSLTDKRFSKIDTFMASTLFDENHGGKYGNCHIALGASYPDTYAGNRADLTKQRKKALGFNDSALHWDLVNTREKTVTAHLKTGKTKVIYENGLFLY